MAEESTALINSLNTRIQELTGENVRRKQANRDLTAKLKKAEDRIGELEKAGGAGSKDLEKANARIKELEGEVKTALQAVKDAPSAHAEENKKLKSDILGRDRRAAFDKAAAGKVRPDALNDAFERVQWGDDEKIDESKVGAEVDRLISERSYLKADPDGSKTDAGGTSKSGHNPRPAGPGSDRGAAPDKANPAPDYGRRIA